MPGKKKVRNLKPISYTKYMVSFSFVAMDMRDFSTKGLKYKKFRKFH